MGNDTWLRFLRLAPNKQAGFRGFLPFTCPERSRRVRGGRVRQAPAKAGVG